MPAEELIRPMSGRTRYRLVLVAIVAAVVASLLSSTANAADDGRVNKPSVNVLGMDTVEVRWDAVTGATAYEVAYKTSSGSWRTFTEKAPNVNSDTLAYVDDLTRKTSYYFRVRALGLDPVLYTDGKGAWSETSSKATPNYEYGSVSGMEPTNIGSTSMEFSWVFNPETLGTPGWRISYSASGHPTKVKDFGSDSNGKITGLAKNTTYSFKVASLLPADLPGEGTQPAVRVGPYSKSIKVKTYNYPVEPPTNVKMAAGGQQSRSIRLQWDAPVGFGVTDKYEVHYAKSSSMKGAVKVVGTNATELDVTGLSPNINYFMRVRVIGPSGTRSSLSDVIQTKTPSARGTVSGTVNGPADRDDLVVVAYGESGDYNKTNLVEQAEVDGSGQWTMRLRPGLYTIFVTHVGQPNITSLWFKSGTNGVPSRENAEKFTVSENGNHGGKNVTLGVGGEISGVVRGNIDGSDIRPDGVDDLKDVDITVRSCFSELSGKNVNRDVIAMTETDASGGYSLNGIPDGDYWMRYVYNSGDGFDAAATAVRLSGGKVVDARPAGDDSVTGQPVSCEALTTNSPIAQVNPVLEVRDYRKRYSISVSGSRRVGSTLKAKTNKYLGASYGASTSHSRISWKWKRGSTTLATGNSFDNGWPPRDYCSSIRCYPPYKVKKSDRGHKLTLEVTYSLYGYKTVVKKYTTSKIK